MELVNKYEIEPFKFLELLAKLEEEKEISIGKRYTKMHKNIARREKFIHLYIAEKLTLTHCTKKRTL